MKKIHYLFYTLSLVLFPTLVLHAQDPSYLYSFHTKLLITGPKLLSLLLGIGLLFFVWGVVKFIAQAGDEKAVAEGKKTMMWSIIAIFVIVSTWGFVNFLIEVFGVDTTNTVSVPQSRP